MAYHSLLFAGRSLNHFHHCKDDKQMQKRLKSPIWLKKRSKISWYIITATGTSTIHFKLCTYIWYYNCTLWTEYLRYKNYSHHPVIGKCTYLQTLALIFSVLSVIVKKLYLFYQWELNLVGQSDLLYEPLKTLH